MRHACLPGQPLLSGFLPQVSQMPLGQVIVIVVGIQCRLLLLSHHGRVRGDVSWWTAGRVSRAAPYYGNAPLGHI
jgi:hypothetical protein